MSTYIKYFYSCDYCGIKKEVESLLKEHDEVECELLKDGWIFISDFHFTVMGKSCRVSGSSNLNGTYCCLKCATEAFKRVIRDRQKN